MQNPRKIESPLGRRLFFRSAALCLSALVLGGSLFASVAQAQTATTLSPKIAADLRPYYSTRLSSLPLVNWAKTINQQTYVQVLIVAASADPSLASLRETIVARKGNVLYNYIAVRALAATVAAADLPLLAARSDVLSIAPNRAATRQASVLQASAGAGDALGALAAWLPPATVVTATAPALDGRGVGIAILDSGIDWSHRNFLLADGKTCRPRRGQSSTAPRPI